LAELSSQERWLLLQAGVLGVIVAVGRRILSLKRLQVVVARALPLANPPLETNETALGIVQRAAHMVQIAAGHSLVRVNCLERSLVLWGLLRRRGIRSDLRIGARKNGEKFEAHAWVECQGVVLNDTPDVGERFVPFHYGVGTTGQHTQ
jgi:hypothetical protein